MEKLITALNEILAYPILDEFDERQTERLIIERLLECLGWNIYDINEVVRQYNIDGLRVDYASRINGRNKCFIEVKKPSENLDKHEEQILLYSFKAGVTISILTNGVEWRFYLPNKTESYFRERRFFTLYLQKQEQGVENVVTNLIELLSRSNIVDDSAVIRAENYYKEIRNGAEIKKILPKAWNKLINEPDPGLVELVIKNVTEMSGLTPTEDLVINFIKNRDELIPEETSINETVIRVRTTQGMIKEHGGTKQKYNNQLPPDNTKCRWVYKGKEFNGVIRDGRIYVDGIEGGFSSFSGACRALSGGISMNGWINWYVYVETKGWILADEWRNNN